MSYSRGEIVWIKFPFSDGSESKLRPALIISNREVNKTGDYLFMQITSRLREDELSLEITDKDFEGKPLRKKGELRLHKIFILNESLITGTITYVSSDFMKTVVNRLNLLIL